MARYEFTPKSVKQFRKLDKQTQFKVIEKLDYFCSTSHPLDYAEPISDKDLGSYRFRIGNFRVVFDIKDDLITIQKVGDRKNIYR